MDPKMTIIVPARNASATIGPCLERILRARSDSDEVIVVDDASVDGTDRTAASWDVRLVRLDANRGAAFARNRGAELAKGEILVFIDSDVAIFADTLGRLRAVMAQLKAQAVFGVFSIDGKKASIASTLKNLYGHYVNVQSAGYVSQFSTCCGAVRKDIFDAMGGFDERFTRANMEDVDLGYRLTARGYRVYLDANIQVEHLKEFSFAGLIRNDFDRARAWTHLLAREKFCRHRPLLKNECNVSRRQLISFGLIFFSLSFGVAGMFQPGLFVPCGLCLGAHLVVNRGFFTLLFKKMKWAAASLAVGQYYFCQAAAVAGAWVGGVDFMVHRR